MDAAHCNADLFIGLGELLWDVFEDSRRPGGAPANVGFHAHQLGLRTEVCSRVGQDELGDELVAYLEAQGLSTTYVQRDPRYPTGTVTVNTRTANAPSYVIHAPVAWDYLSFEASWEGLFRNAAAVCFGTLAQRQAESRATIRKAVETASAALIVYDVNLRPPHYDAETIHESMQRADVAKMNEDEAKELDGLLKLDGGDLEGIAAALRAQYDLTAVCVTRGADGCYMASANDVAHAPGVPVTVKDAVGAGDAFTAAMTYGLLAKWPVEAIAPFANHAGALVASHSGGMPSLVQEFDELKQRMAPSRG